MSGKAKKYEMDRITKLLIGRPAVITAFLLFVANLAVQLSPPDTPWRENLMKVFSQLSLGVAISAFLVLGDLYRRNQQQEADFERIPASLDRLSAAVERRIEVRLLATAEQVFEALCRLREESTDIRLMMMRDEPPASVVDAAPSGKRGTTAGLRYKKGSKHALEWYEKLPHWLADNPDHKLERLTCNSTPEMVAYHEVATAALRKALDEAGDRGGDWQQHVLDTGGTRVGQLPPFLNLCLFDEIGLVITFSGLDGDRQHANLKGLMIRNPDIVRFFEAQYYEPFKRYIATRKALPLAGAAARATP